MRILHIFLFEGKHFIRSTFKVIALLLFILAGIYGLHNGATLYNSHKTEIEKLSKKAEQERQNVINYYKEGKKGPTSKPSIDFTSPFWAMYSLENYEFKKPSVGIVYSIGQAEQYGFYKKVTFQSSPYDADMAEEIANPERLQTGTLDFSFVILFLLPLMLLILIYNIKSFESEQDFLSLVLVQSASKNTWLLSRFIFYFILIFTTIIFLLLYGAFLTDIFSSENNILIEFTLLISLYLLIWFVLYYIIISKGTTILGNTLQMVGLYLFFTFIIPATVHQWVSIKKPTNLMTDYIDATRDKVYELYDEPDSLIQEKIFKQFPQLRESKFAKDSTKSTYAMNYSFSILSNKLMKESIETINKENEQKNNIIQNTYWFNPVVYFQNKLNLKAETHYQDYRKYRNKIQTSIDSQIEILIPDIYNDVKVNENKYLDYIKQTENDQ